MNQNPDQSILQYMDADLLDVPPKKTLLSLAIGLTTGLALGAGAIVLLRGMESESDGLRALVPALAVVVPMLLVTVLLWWGQRGQTKRVMNKLAIFVAMIGGLGFGAAIGFVAPTERSIINAMLLENKPTIQGKAKALVKFWDQVNAFSHEPLDGGFAEQQLEELRLAPLNLIKGGYDLSGSWNTLLAVETDFARLKLDTDPDTIMQSWDRPKPLFKTDRYKYSNESGVDQIASVAFGDSYLWTSEAQDFVAMMQQLEYVLIVRITDTKEAELGKDSYRPGLMRGQVFLFRFSDEQLVGGFDFVTTHSESIKYSFDETGTSEDEMESARNELKENLRDNAWPALCVKLHSVVESAISDFENLELPYTNDWVNAANEYHSRNAAVVPPSVPKKPTEPDSAKETEIELTAAQRAEVLELLKTSKLNAITKVRKLTGASLKKCKEFVESM